MQNIMEAVCPHRKCKLCLCKRDWEREREREREREVYDTTYAHLVKGFLKYDVIVTKAKHLKIACVKTNRPSIDCDVTPASDYNMENNPSSKYSSDYDNVDIHMISSMLIHLYLVYM